MQETQQIQTKSGNGSLVAFAVIAAIVIIGVMAWVGPGTGAGNGWSYFSGSNNTSNTSQQSMAPASGTSVVGGPTISAQKIDAILTNAVSPAAGTGQDLYNLGVRYGIDPAFAMSVFFNESNFGKAGEAVNSHSLGNLRCIDGAACVHGYAWFNNWQDGYAAFYKLISGPLYAGSGLTTPETILPKYAPSGDNNNPSHYASVVESCISLWRSGSTGIPS